LVDVARQERSDYRGNGCTVRHSKKKPKSRMEVVDAVVSNGLLYTTHGPS
jgi:hypothetical protein